MKVQNEVCGKEIEAEGAAATVEFQDADPRAIGGEGDPVRELHLQGGRRRYGLRPGAPPSLRGRPPGPGPPRSRRVPHHPVAALAGEERLGDLLRAGTEVLRWRGATIHAKSVVVDGRWVLVGSSNLDALSLHRNAELNVEIHGSAVGTLMTRLFRQDLENSEAYTLADWHARGPARRLAARAAGVFAPWL